VIKESWNILYKKPLTGMGLGSWEHRIGGDPNVVAKLRNQNWKEAHNEYWQAWWDTGLIGLILLLMAIGSTIRRFTRKITLETVTLASSMVVILIASMSYFILRVSPLSIYTVLIYGLLEQKIGEVI
jgi:O-antigen ligase